MINLRYKNAIFILMLRIWHTKNKQHRQKYLVSFVYHTKYKNFFGVNPKNSDGGPWKPEEQLVEATRSDPSLGSIRNQQGVTSRKGPCPVSDPVPSWLCIFGDLLQWKYRWSGHTPARRLGYQHDQCWRANGSASSNELTQNIFKIITNNLVWWHCHRVAPYEM